VLIVNNELCMYCSFARVTCSGQLRVEWSHLLARPTQLCSSVAKNNSETDYEAAEVILLQNNSSSYEIIYRKRCFSTRFINLNS
jgi:hypothetical protein